MQPSRNQWTVENERCFFVLFNVCYVMTNLLGLKYDPDFDDGNSCWHGRGYKVKMYFKTQ